MLGQWHLRWVIVAAALALSLASAAPGAVGDFVDVYLRDGRHFFGQVTAEDENVIEVEVYHGEIRMPMKFAARDVEKIVRHERKPGDEDAPEADTDEDPNDDAWGANDDPGARGGFAIVPIEGTFGEEVTAGFFQSAIRQAERDGAEAIIFHINSPGGLVSELDRIRDELDEHENLAIAFYVDEEAFSAAALLCMSSDFFFVGPGARIGAAVAFSFKAGAAQVDAKFNAAFAATWRAHAQRAGRDPAIVDAMIDMTKELWADTRTEPWTVYAERPAGAAGDDDGAEDEDPYRLIDDDKHVLALDHIQALNIGAVDGEERTPRAVVDHLGLTEDEREAFDGERFSERYFRTYRNNIERAERAVRDVKEVANMLGAAQNNAELRNQLRTIMSNANRVVTLYDQYDYVRNYIHAQGHTKEQFEELARLIRRALGRG